MSDTASEEPSPKREYPEVSSNALAVLQKRYFLKDRIDHPAEDVEGFFNRVVRGVVDVELERGWVDKSGHAELVDSMYGLVRGLQFQSCYSTTGNRLKHRWKDRVGFTQREA